MARSGDFGWAGSGIWVRMEGLGKSKKVNLGRKWVETVDEGKFSCENGFSRILGLLCAEQHVGNLKKWTFGKSWIPVRRTERRTSQNNDFQKLCDSCAQNKTSEISKNALLGILGHLGAEQVARMNSL